MDSGPGDRLGLGYWQRLRVWIVGLRFPAWAEESRGRCWGAMPGAAPWAPFGSG